jgi:hypothetical protein
MAKIAIGQIDDRLREKNPHAAALSKPWRALAEDDEAAN